MKTACALALLGLIAGVANASRIPSNMADDMFSSGLRGAQGIQHLISRGKGHDESEGAYVTFRYTVPTDKKEDFVERWRALEKRIASDKENVIIDLKKTTTDNYRFLGYGEWERKEAFLDFLKSDDSQDWVEYTMKNNILLEIEPLLAPAEDTRPSSDEKHHGKEKHHLFHIIVKYVVAPEDAKDFIGAWQKVQKGTDEEEGCQIYSLRKTAGDNFQYYTYATFETLKDYMEHLSSDYTKDFLKFVDDRQIVWNLSPLFKVGEQPE